MERAREERRQQMEARKDRKEREKLSNAEKGVVGDVDFVRMISAWREANKDQSKPHATFSTNEAEKNAGGAICICVRKRPISRREVNNKDHDAVSCVHPSVVVHDCRLRVDGISKYLNNQQFAFDHAFSENEDTAEIYRCVGGPLVEFVTRDDGRACIFAYGQTGSGKTYTMGSSSLPETRSSRNNHRLNHNHHHVYEDDSISNSFVEESNNDPNINYSDNVLNINDPTAGILPRVAKRLFDKITNNHQQLNHNN